MTIYFEDYQKLQRKKAYYREKRRIIHKFLTACYFIPDKIIRENTTIYFFVLQYLSSVYNNIKVPDKIFYKAYKDHIKYNDSSLHIHRNYIACWIINMCCAKYGIPRDDKNIDYTKKIISMIIEKFLK